MRLHTVISYALLLCGNWVIEKWRIERCTWSLSKTAGQQRGTMGSNEKERSDSKRVDNVCRGVRQM